MHNDDINMWHCDMFNSDVGSVALGTHFKIVNFNNTYYTIIKDNKNHTV